MVTLTVAVGWTSRRPVVPDQHVCRVIVTGRDDVDAMLAAAQMVAVHPRCVMVTSTTLLDWCDT
jgi:hypothetical protein